MRTLFRVSRAESDKRTDWVLGAVQCRTMTGPCSDVPTGVRALVPGGVNRVGAVDRPNLSARTANAIPGPVRTNVRFV